MNFKMITAALAATALTGCAMSAEGLGKAKLENAYTSAKPAAEVAGCIASRLHGSNPAFQQADGHWVVTRVNGYGVPTVRWDIVQQPDGGSKIEFRRSVAVMSGEEKAATCF